MRAASLGRRRHRPLGTRERAAGSNLAETGPTGRAYGHGPVAAALLLLLHCQRLSQRLAAGSGRGRLGPREGRGHLWLEGKAKASPGSRLPAGAPRAQVLARRRAGTGGYLWTPGPPATGFSAFPAAHPASGSPGARLQVPAGMKGAADPWLCVVNEARPLAMVRLPRAGGWAERRGPCAPPFVPGPLPGGCASRIGIFRAVRMTGALRSRCGVRALDLQSTALRGLRAAREGGLEC